MEGSVVLCAPSDNFAILIANGFVVYTCAEGVDESTSEVFMTYLAASLLQRNQLTQNIYILASSPCKALLKLLRNDGVLAQRFASVNELLVYKKNVNSKLKKEKMLNEDIHQIYRYVWQYKS
jgi:hypothetical protein